MAGFVSMVQSRSGFSSTASNRPKISTCSVAPSSLGGSLLIVNNVRRAVPTLERGWANDGIDIRQALANSFTLEAGEILVSPAVSSPLSGRTFWAAYRNGAG